jgi:adenylyl-sulfate kinase
VTAPIDPRFLNGLHTVSRGPTVWFTGLSGAGKTTIAQSVAVLLRASRVAHHLLDGDEIRSTLSSDLGFSREDRAEQVRRVGHLALMLSTAGVIPLVALVSPFRADRDLVRSLHPRGRFLEVHVDTPLAVCEQRDTKGLYAGSRTGEVEQLTGVSQVYEAPLCPEIRIVADGQRSLEVVAQEVFDGIVDVMQANYLGGVDR